MKIALFGASGHIGSAIADELLSRGHEVTAVTRSGSGDARPGLTVKSGDITDPETVIALVEGHDAVASAVGPKVGVENDEEILLGAARSLVEALPKTDVRRVVVLGGAGSLKTPSGERVVDNPHFPAMWKANALAQIAVLDLFRTVDDLDWTFISPAAHIEPGERTGEYRVGGDDLLVDENGDSNISIPDYAVAFVDELEKGNAIKRRIGVAY
ncbi:NAD(P)-dependent oxidoreductase [Saccharothrix sp. HUAS TT1]|uniref:NAD(P)-dependent oxidoreductase n=1 Tax=unclassified Saccharothrix TaxID=2593673 RepID=UPI00345C512A